MTESGQEKSLSNEEIRHIREIIEKDKRWKWLATTMRNTAAWTAAIVGAIIIGGEFIAKILKALVR